MIVCLDLDGTATADPEFYRHLTAGLRAEGIEVHVLSGHRPGPVSQDVVAMKESLLASLGFRRGEHYDQLAAVSGPEGKVPGGKVDYMRHVGASCLIDNSRPNVKAARKAGFLALRHMVPK